ncbi:MAG: enoyl-CoA hydratase/isomerase family protein [Halioglobus sp.]
MSVLDRSDIGNCAVLTMNRPESLNAITTEMLDQLEHHLDVIEKDDSRAFILTGTGRGFCPGTDLKEPPSDVKQRVDHVHGIVLRMVEFPKLSVAAINGLALGGGLELAMACNFRVACAEAKLGLPEIKIGLMPAYGGTVLLPRIVGAARAEAMMLSGASLTADEAQHIGLVNALCDTPEAVVACAHDFMQDYCNFSLVPQQAIRRAIREGQQLPLAQALPHEFKVMEQVNASEDCIEGVMSFIEKRAPVWKDR